MTHMQDRSEIINNKVFLANLQGVEQKVRRSLDLKQMLLLRQNLGCFDVSTSVSIKKEAIKKFKLEKISQPFPLDYKSETVSFNFGIYILTSKYLHIFFKNFLRKHSWK